MTRLVLLVGLVAFWVGAWMADAYRRKEQEGSRAGNTRSVKGARLTAEDPYTPPPMYDCPECGGRHVRASSGRCWVLGLTGSTSTITLVSGMYGNGGPIQ